MYMITLANGNTINEVELNGSLFFTKQNISRDTFRAGLAHVSISGSTNNDNPDWTTGLYDNLRLSYFRDAGDVREFCFSRISADELERLQQCGDIDYIAMMTGVQL